MDEWMQNETAVEGELRAALQRVPAPEGFTDRVMARVAKREAKRQPSRPGNAGILQRRTGWITAVAAMLMLTMGGDLLHVRHQRREVQAKQAQEQSAAILEGLHLSIRQGRAKQEQAQSDDRFAARQYWTKASDMNAP